MGKDVEGSVRHFLPGGTEENHKSFVRIAHAMAKIRILSKVRNKVTCFPFDWPRNLKERATRETYE
jgi:hypothetical protein